MPINYAFMSDCKNDIDKSYGYSSRYDDSCDDCESCDDGYFELCKKNKEEVKVSEEQQALDFFDKNKHVDVHKKILFLLLPKNGVPLSPILKGILEQIDGLGLRSEGDIVNYRGHSLEISHSDNRRWFSSDVQIRFSTPGFTLQEYEKEWNNTAVLVSKTNLEWSQKSARLVLDSEVPEGLRAGALMWSAINWGDRFLFTEKFCGIVKKPIRGSWSNKWVTVNDALKARALLREDNNEVHRMLISLIGNISIAAVNINESPLFKNPEYKNQLGPFDAYAASAILIKKAKVLTEALMEISELKKSKEITGEESYQRTQKIRESFHDLAIASLPLVNYWSELNEVKKAIKKQQDLMESLKEKHPEMSGVLSDWDAKYDASLNNKVEKNELLYQLSMEEVSLQKEKVNASLEYLQDLNQRKLLPVSD